MTKTEKKNFQQTAEVAASILRKRIKIQSNLPHFHFKSKILSLARRSQNATMLCLSYLNVPIEFMLNSFTFRIRLPFVPFVLMLSFAFFLSLYLLWKIMTIEIPHLIIIRQISLIHLMILYYYMYFLVLCTIEAPFRDKRESFLSLCF